MKNLDQVFFNQEILDAFPLSISSRGNSKSLFGLSRQNTVKITSSVTTNDSPSNVIRSKSSLTNDLSYSYMYSPTPDSASFISEIGTEPTNT